MASPLSGGFVAPASPRGDGQVVFLTAPERSADTVHTLSQTRGARQGELSSMPHFDVSGDGGGGVFTWDALSTDPENTGTVIGSLPVGRWKRVFDGQVSVRWFGARGDDSQTLLSEVYTSDVAHTQQTRDGAAINRAIRYLRSVGGGTLYLPKGAYRVWGYLETIDFPCKVVGDGIGSTVIKTCDLAPWTNGHGIFRVYPQTLTSISIEAVTLDGSADERTGASEVRAYTLAAYGPTRLTLNSVESKNSIIDCLLVNLSLTGDVSLQASNCLFSNSFRNTVSVVSGSNLQFTNCIIEKGGRVGSGVHPRYCVDIEPDVALNSIRHVTFANCIIRNAVAVLVGGIWAGDVKLVGCTLDATESAVDKYFTNVRGGEFTFTGCSFIEKGDYNGKLLLEPPSALGEFVETQFCEFRGCNFEGGGVRGYGSDMRFSDCSFRNSRHPILFGGTGTKSLTLRNVSICNIIDSANHGSGAYSSVSVSLSYEGAIDVDGLTVRMIPSQLPSTVAFVPAAGRLFGINMGPAASTANDRKVCNVHVSGFYRKYPSSAGHTLNASFFRDWYTPSLPPGDTSGQTAAPGSIFFKNCTHYGDAD